jgi:DNA-3-methyladenine glycosylase
LRQLIRRRRPAAKRAEDLASGPWRLTLAVGVTRKQDGVDLIWSALQVRGLRDEPLVEITATQRIGITHCADWPLRFLIAGNRFVSR